MADFQFAEPSLLPGWTRGHVVAHLVLNAEGLAGALEGVREERAVPMYASQEARDGDIEELAGADPGVLRDRLLAATTAIHDAVDGAPEDLYAGRIERTPGSDRTFTAGRVGEMRLREVEIHHADLDLAYTWADWPSDFTRPAARRAAARRTTRPAVHGARRRPGPLVGVRRAATGGPRSSGTAADPGMVGDGPGPGDGLTSDGGDAAADRRRGEMT